ncbi:MAG: cyclic nucleotide-binding domain-containing protein [Ignavibacteriales bacterium]|nr:MAG: cyclic nucleotide-binding domain-containing protein [Ignavibacteriales bacterium]
MAENNDESVHSNFWANIFKSPSGKPDFERTIQTVPPFKYLKKRDLTQIYRIIHDRNYVAGEYIFMQGDPGIGLYIIREGEISIQRKTENGTIIHLAEFKKGDFFGELALVDGEKRSASAIAKTDAKISVIFKPDLDEFIETHPKIGIKVLNGIAEIIAVRLRALNEDYISILTSRLQSGESRLKLN